MRDGIVLSDGEENVIVNQRSYCELIKWLIVEYTGVSYQEASGCVEQRLPFFESINSVLDAALESHDWPYYYTAMRMYFGHAPVKTILPPPDQPEGLSLYQKIEADILDHHHLSEPIIWKRV